MNHDSISRRLSPYMDGEVGADERVLIERHLAECGVCAAMLREMRGISEAVRGLPAMTLAPGLVRRLHAGVDVVGRKPVERFVGLLSGIAACLAVMGGLLLMRPTTASASVSPPDQWEGHAVGIMDESANASGTSTRENAIGQWMVSSLGAEGQGHE